MILSKIFDNIGLKAIRALGIRQYALMFFQFILAIPKVLKDRNLVALDKRMSRFPITIYFEKYKYYIDLPFIDKVIQEGSFTFGGVREIFIRKCYFRFHKINTSEIKTVVDLGGNRGLFSMLCASFSSKIITVEPNPDYNDVIIKNIKNVNPKVYHVVINRFVGGKGMHAIDNKNLSVSEIMSENYIDKIDFLKIDIEGSEFGLFDEKFPFDRINYISMEVHREYGDPVSIINQLQENNFQTFSSTSNFNLTSSNDEIDYIYAKNRSFFKV